MGLHPNNNRTRQPTQPSFVSVAKIQSMLGTLKHAVQLAAIAMGRTKLIHEATAEDLQVTGHILMQWSCRCRHTHT